MVTPVDGVVNDEVQLGLEVVRPAAGPVPRGAAAAARRRRAEQAAEQVAEVAARRSRRW